MAAQTKFTYSSGLTTYEVTFTRDPHQQPSGRNTPDQGRIAYTRDMASVRQRTTTVDSRRRHELGWENLPIGTETATGGTDWLGLRKFYRLVGGSAMTWTYTDEDGAAHADCGFAMPEGLPEPWENGVVTGSVKVVVWED